MYKSALLGVIGPRYSGGLQDLDAILMRICYHEEDLALPLAILESEERLYQMVEEMGEERMQLILVGLRVLYHKIGKSEEEKYCQAVGDYFLTDCIGQDPLKRTLRRMLHTFVHGKGGILDQEIHYANLLASKKTSRAVYLG